MIYHDLKTGARDSPVTILTGIAWGRLQAPTAENAYGIFFRTTPELTKET